MASASVCLSFRHHAVQGWAIASDRAMGRGNFPYHGQVVLMLAAWREEG